MNFTNFGILLGLWAWLQEYPKIGNICQIDAVAAFWQVGVENIDFA